MNDLNNRLILDNVYSPENNKKSSNLSNDGIQKKSFQLLSEEKLLPTIEKIIQEAETTLVSKKEIAEKNEETIIKDGDADIKKLKQIKIEHDLKKDFIDAREETLKINHFINEQEKQLKLLHEERLKIDQDMLNFEKNKNQLQVEFIDKQKKLINKNEEEIKGLKSLNQEYQEKITSLEDTISNLKNNEEEIKFYQNDNLRLSNKLFETSKKLEDHKVRINKFDNNKSQIQEQIHNINKIISKNNIVKEQFPQKNNIQNISNNIVKEKTDIESEVSNKNYKETSKELADIDIQTKKIFFNY